MDCTKNGVWSVAAKLLGKQNRKALRLLILDKAILIAHRKG